MKVKIVIKILDLKRMNMIKKKKVKSNSRNEYYVQWLNPIQSTWSSHENNVMSSLEELNGRHVWAYVLSHEGLISWDKNTIERFKIWLQHKVMVSSWVESWLTRYWNMYSCEKIIVDLKRLCWSMKKTKVMFMVILKRKLSPWRSCISWGNKD